MNGGVGPETPVLLILWGEEKGWGRPSLPCLPGKSRGTTSFTGRRGWRDQVVQGSKVEVPPPPLL